MANRHGDSSAKKHGQWSSKNKKGTRPVLILATHRHTTESVGPFTCSMQMGMAMIKYHKIPMLLLTFDHFLFALEEKSLMQYTLTIPIGNRLHVIPGYGGIQV